MAVLKKNPHTAGFFLLPFPVLRTLTYMLEAAKVSNAVLHPSARLRVYPHLRKYSSVFFKIFISDKLFIFAHYLFFTTQSFNCRK